MENVLLVFGGVSYEHDISVVTALQIFKKSRLTDKKLILFYVSRDGKYYICDEKKIQISDFSKNNFKYGKKGFREVCFVSGEKQKIFTKTRFGLKEILTAKVAIFACHGGIGENGKLVTIFNDMGFSTSAGSPNALSICMNKYLFKVVSRGLKIPVVDGFKLSKNEPFDKKLKMKLGKLGYPIVVKINSGGSSIGLFVAKNYEEFLRVVKEAFCLDDEIIVEKFIKNAREFNVAILGNENCFEVSDVDEPIKTNEVLTFADKYLAKNPQKNKSGKGGMESSVRKVPNDLSEEQVCLMKSIAEKIFVKLGLSGVIRIDFLYDTNNKKIYVCEVNTIPGSLAFYFFKKNKIVTNDLIERLIKLSENYDENLKIKQNFVVDVLSKE